MNNNIFAENLKKFRIAKNLTQEQVADALRVTAQTVSRWECANTLPDVLTLPALAKLYGVMVDDFYKKQSVVYENYAQRLGSVYEKTRDPEDFLRAILEFQKQMKDHEPSTRDKWEYAFLYHDMVCECKKKALEWYDKAIADGPENDLHSYRRARSLRNDLLFLLGKGDEVLRTQKEKCESAPNDAEDWACLIEAYFVADRYDEGYEIFLKTIERFPENWLLYILGGDICEKLKKYDEAFRYWDKAGELGTYFYDEYYCKASCYHNMGEYEKAYNMYMTIAEKLRADHWDVEADMAEDTAKEIKHKMK